MTDSNSLIFVADHRGMIGRAIIRRLNALDYTDIVNRNHWERDFLIQQAVMDFMENDKVYQVYLALTKVGKFMPKKPIQNLSMKT